MAPAGITPSPQRILVPLDGSPLAELALTEAVALSKLPNAEVILLQVVPPIEEVMMLGLEQIALDQQWELQREQALRYLRSVSARPEWRGVHVDVAVDMGSRRRPFWRSRRSTALAES